MLVAVFVAAQNWDSALQLHYDVLKAHFNYSLSLFSLCIAFHAPYFYFSRSHVCARSYIECRFPLPHWHTWHCLHAHSSRTQNCALIAKKYIWRECELQIILSTQRVSDFDEMASEIVKCEVQNLNFIPCKSLVQKWPINYQRGIELVVYWQKVN